MTSNPRGYFYIHLTIYDHYLKRLVEIVHDTPIYCLPSAVRWRAKEYIRHYYNIKNVVSAYGKREHGKKHYPII